MPKILVIDDKMDNLVTLSALLDNLMPDCAVITAQSGMEGIEKAKAELPDAILLDVKMPDMDGFETCRRLKSDESTKHIPVIMITAIKTNSQSRIRGLEIGAEAFLAKPIDPYELVSQVKVALRIKKAEDALREERDSLERLVEERTAALKKSEERYRSLIEHQTDLVCRFLPDGQFVFVNDMYSQFFNKPKEELIGNTWEPLPVGDDIEIIKEKLSTLSPVNPIVIIENRVFSGKGEIHWMQFINHGFFNAKGDLQEIQSVGRDITDIKNAEFAIHESTETLKRAQSVGKIGSWWYDPATQMPIWTDEMFHIFGLEPQPEAIPFEEHRNIIHPEDWDRFDAAVTRAVSEGVGFNLELRITHPNGEIRYVDTRCDAKKNDDGIVTQLIGTTQDITDRKQAEFALIESESQYRTLVDTIPDLVWLKDKDGNYLSCNLMFERFFGAEKSEIVGKTDYDFVDKDLADFFRANDRKAMASDKPSVNEEALTFADNGYRGLFETIKTAMRDKNGNLIGVLGIARDISERERAAQEKLILERQLKQSQKLESIGNLAGGIAHDFNNILSSVLGFTELSLDEVEKGTHIGDNLQEVYAAGKRAKDLVKQILAFARQSEEELKPIQVDMIATEVLKLIRSSIPTTIEIKQNIESDSLITGNATQVHQILMNLFTNAAHAMEDKGGILTFNMKDVVMDRGVNREKLDLKPGNYIEIKVSDTGTGIPSEIITSIFEPYFTTKGPGEGTGMGLAVVHGIVESCGGNLSVDSTPGEGTTFTIHLPITRKRQENRQYEPGDLPSGTERILFVDDEAPIAKMVGQILERLGYSVTIRTNSIEALELFRVKPDDFDLVVTDMTMPNLTGDKLSVELMKIRPSIPVILCTGYSKMISDETASEIGIKAFAYKPVVKAELAKTVRKVLDETKE